MQDRVVVSITKEFVEKLQHVSEKEPLFAVLLKKCLQAKDDLTIQTILNEYSESFRELSDPEDRNKLSVYFWEIIESLKLPFIEVNHDGSFQAYFLYKNQQTNNNDLYIQGDYHGYGSTFPTQKLNRIGDTDVMCCVTPINNGLHNALITYHFVEVPPKNVNEETLIDLNDQKYWTPDPYGKNTKAYEKIESQFCVNAKNDMGNWRVSEPGEWPSFEDIHKDSRLTHWVQHPDGHITRGMASFDKDFRSIQVFKPTGMVENIVIVNDGFAYLLCDGLNQIQAIAEKNNCALIFISPMFGLGDPTVHPLGIRGLEYHINVDQYATFILENLLPELNKQGVIHYPHPTNMTVIGASMSGIAALRMGLTHPDQFTNVIAHSPAPIGRDKIDEIPDVSDIASQMRIDIECGIFENPKNAYANDNLSYAHELGKLFNVPVHVGLHGHQTEGWVVDLKRSLPAVMSLINENKIIECMQDINVYGVSTALVSNSGDITTKEYGFSDKESKSQVNPTTVFGAASLSKVVFAYLVLKLIQKKELSINEDLNKTLSFSDFCHQVGMRCDRSLKNIKLNVRDILSHTTGLDDSKDGVVQKTKAGNYWYSGVPLWYLQKVIEVKTGLSLEELAKKYVFSSDACDMQHSTFYRKYELEPIIGPLKRKHQTQTLYIETDDKSGLTYEVIGLDGQLERNTLPWHELPVDFPRNVSEIIKEKEKYLPILIRHTCAANHTTKEDAISANSLFTTAEDYAKFVSKWMNEENELLKSAFSPIVSMRTDDWAKAVGVPKQDLNRIAWGLGWGLELDQNGQVKKAYHTGDMNNWRAWVAIDFDKKEALVYFANSPNGHVLADQLITPHIELPHAFNYFSKKYGFAVKFEPNWKEQEEARFKTIIRCAVNYAAPRITQLQSSFFKSAVKQQLQSENRLMPASVSWWEQELKDKREILENFWQGRIVNLNQKSVDEFKKHIINTHFPKSPEWEMKINKLFSDAIAKKIDFDDFFAELKYLPMVHIRGMAVVENIPLPHAGETLESKLEIEPSDLINIKRYMVERGMTGAVSFGIGNKSIITPNYSDSSQCVYAMHSVGKVFTGMLTLIMISKGIIPESMLTEPLSQEFINTLNLPSSTKKHLLENKVTLHQLMTHKAGLGDYLGDYGKAISQGKIPEMNKPEDFLQFAESTTSQVGEEHYSNLGILLAGLAVKHAYEQQHGACEYDELLSKYIIDQVGMPSFSSKPPGQNIKYNSADSVAPHVAGSPAGGYWVTSEDLAKFGRWIYKLYQEDPKLPELLKKYGQEFYNEKYNVISHAGVIPSSSAFLSVSLDTGAVVAALSDQPDMAFELNSLMQVNVFSKRTEVVKDHLELPYKR